MEKDIYGFRCRVRIVGYHDCSDDLPDEDLPLAHILLPPNVSTTGGCGKNCEISRWRSCCWIFFGW